MNVDAPTPSRRRERVPLPTAATPPVATATAGPHGAAAAASSRARAARPVALRVLDGLQAGARVPLRRGARLAIGGAPDDDIVLRDPRVGGARCTLEPRGGGVRLHVVAEPVSLDAESLPVGHRVTLAADARLRLGDVGIALVGASEGEAPASPASRSDDDPARDADLVPNGASGGDAARDAAALPVAAAARSPSPVPTTSAPGGVGKRAARVASLVVLALGLGALVAAATGRFEAPPPPRPTIEQALSTEPFAGLAVVGDGGVFRIDGVLPDRDVLRELDALLDASGLAHVNRVETEGTLAAKVIDVLRVNGIEAALVAVDGADVAVATAVPLERDLDEIVRAVERDVPALGALTIDNVPPPPLPSTAEPAHDPGKRVALVVSAPPAHVVTEDRSRYFVGAVLPSGHRIAAIADNRVTLEKDGERTEMQF